MSEDTRNAKRISKGGNDLARAREIVLKNSFHAYLRERRGDLDATLLHFGLLPALWRQPVASYLQAKKHGWSPVLRGPTDDMYCFLASPGTGGVEPEDAAYNAQFDALYPIAIRVRVDAKPDDIRAFLEENADDLARRQRLHRERGAAEKSRERARRVVDRNTFILKLSKERVPAAEIRERVHEKFGKKLDVGYIYKIISKERRRRT